MNIIELNALLAQLNADAHPDLELIEFYEKKKAELNERLVRNINKILADTKL